MNEEYWAYLASVLSLSSAGVLVSLLGKAKGTTLAAPLGWSVFSAMCIGLACWPSVCGSNRQHWLVYVAVITLFLPEMAILGAKRPQDKGWQFIVGSLLLVLLIPVGQSLVFSAGGELVFHWPWRVFLWTLVIVGIVNHAGSKVFVPGIMLGAAQLLLLSHQLWLPIDFGMLQSALAMGLAFVASIVISRMVRSKNDCTGFDRVWIDFRDAFGNLWALRIMERINHLANQEQWPVELAWSGFRSKERSDGLQEGLQKEIPSQEIEACLRTLLRRFVSPAWIDRRLQAGQ